MSHGPRRLSPSKALAAQLLAAGWSQLETAVIAGTSPRSIRRWLQEDDEFRRAVVLEGRMITTQTRARIRAAQGLAVDALLSVLAVDRPMAKLAAARALLAAARDIEVEELELRIDTIERSLIQEKVDD